MFSLEKKFSTNPSLADKYKETMKDYIDKGHATKLSQKEAQTVSNITNYIPHHGVININKPNKVRIVFNAGAKTKGKSLNDQLLKGANLLNNLLVFY